MPSLYVCKPRKVSMQQMAYGGVKTCEKSRLTKWSSRELSIPGSLWSAISSKHSYFKKGSFFFFFPFIYLFSGALVFPKCLSNLKSNLHLGEEIILRVRQII